MKQDTLITMFKINHNNNGMRNINPATDRQNEEKNRAKAHQIYELIKAKKIDQAITECKMCVKIHDAFMDRYHHNTKLVYDDLGLCYYKMENYKLAVASFRMKERIYSYLNGHVPMFGNFELSLSKVGLSQKEILNYESNLNMSTKLEKEGDEYRKMGSFVDAIFKYEQAIRMEKDAIGNDFTLPFLYRKIAQIIFICKVLNSDILPNLQIKWNQIDRINRDNNSKIRSQITTKIFEKRKTLHKTFNAGTVLQYDQILNIYEAIYVADRHHTNCNYKKELRCYNVIDENYNEQEIRLGEKNYKTRI